MTITLPWRRITLHLSQMGLTLGLTFMVFFFLAGLVHRVDPRAVPYPAEGLLVAVNDAATGQVVRAQLDDHAILREDADVVLAHFARNMGKHPVAVGQLNSKHCVGQSFDYCAFDLDDTVFFGHCLFVAKNVVRTGRADNAAPPSNSLCTAELQVTRRKRA